MHEGRVKPNWKMWLGLFGLAVLLFVVWSGVSSLRLKAVDSYVECLNYPGAIVQDKYFSEYAPKYTYAIAGEEFTAIRGEEDLGFYKDPPEFPPNGQLCLLPDGRSFSQPLADDTLPPNDSEAGWPPSQ